jgi:GNAT superfamily N-acetyltransferase
MHLLSQLLYRLITALKVFRENGLRAGFVELGQTIWRIFYQRAEYTAMAKELSRQAYPAAGEPDLIIRRATTREEILALSSIADLADMARFQRMFDQGSVVLIALRGGQAVGYGWISHRIDRRTNRLQPPLRPGDACLHDLFVSPAHRGQGIAQALVARRLQFLREEGYKRSIIAVAQGNAPALRVAEKAGYRPVGEMSHTRLLFWDRLTYKAIPAEP